jgi:hypothetical protein
VNPFVLLRLAPVVALAAALGLVISSMSMGDLGRVGPAGVLVVLAVLVAMFEVMLGDA